MKYRKCAKESGLWMKNIALDLEIRCRKSMMECCNIKNAHIWLRSQRLTQWFLTNAHFFFRCCCPMLQNPDILSWKADRLIAYRLANGVWLAEFVYFILIRHALKVDSRKEKSIDGFNLIFGCQQIIDWWLYRWPHTINSINLHIFDTVDTFDLMEKCNLFAFTH